MKAMVGVVAIACAVGCGMTVSDSVETDQTHQAATVTCPDRDDPCALHNGGGVYTEEHGNASIGPNDLMLLRFVNAGPGAIDVVGRGTDANGDYRLTTGRVNYAYYNGVGYTVYSIGESLTSPKVLLGPSGLVPVNGDNIVNLLLWVSIDGGEYTLSWTNAGQLAGTRGYNQANVLLHLYNMSWQRGFVTDPTGAQPYCTRAPIAGSTVDPVVFQQEIGVNPLTAETVQNSSYVTISCQHGAIATVRWWGYVYRGTQTQSETFEAAMHMKRASYCGDASFFTKANTEILIRDAVPNQHDDVNVSNVEAVWGKDSNGTIRALCVDQSNRRRPGIDWLGDPPDYTCKGTVPGGIPACPSTGTLPLLANQLADAPSP